CRGMFNRTAWPPATVSGVDVGGATTVTAGERGVCDPAAGCAVVLSVLVGEPVADAFCGDALVCGVVCVTRPTANPIRRATTDATATCHVVQRRPDSCGAPCATFGCSSSAVAAWSSEVEGMTSFCAGSSGGAS